MIIKWNKEGHKIRKDLTPLEREKVASKKEISEQRMIETKVTKKK